MNPSLSPHPSFHPSSVLRRSRWGGFLAAAVIACSASTAAQSVDSGASGGEEPSPRLRPSVELITEFAHLTRGYGEARTQSVKVGQGTAIGNVDVSATHQSRFGESGNYLGVQLTRELNERSYFSVALGGGSSVLWPVWRGDVNYYRKLGADKNTVLGLGYMYASNRQQRDDRGLLASLTVYGDGLVLEAGLHANRNNPGRVKSGSQYAVATWGADQVQVLTLRGETAQEAYQLIGGNEQLVDFDSRNLSLEWRYWWKPGQSLILGGKVYRNPYYTQTDLKLGVKIDL